MNIPIIVTCLKLDTETATFTVTLSCGHELDPFRVADHAVLSVHDTLGLPNVGEVRPCSICGSHRAIETVPVVYPVVYGVLSDVYDAPLPNIHGGALATTQPPDWPLVALNDDGMRPAGPPDECFYCRQKVGQPHALNCVCVTKRVRLRYIIEVDVDVPHSWTQEDIEFQRGESSWCADNAIDDIERHVAQFDARGWSEGPCLCDRFQCEYVGIVDNTPTRELRTPEDVAADDAFRVALQQEPTQKH